LKDPLSARLTRLLILRTAFFTELQFNSIRVGLGISALLSIPIGLLDLFVVFSGSKILAWFFLIVPYLIYLGLAAVLTRDGFGELRKGLAIGGVVFSTLIIIGIWFWVTSIIANF